MLDKKTAVNFTAVFFIVVSLRSTFYLQNTFFVFAAETLPSSVALSKS
jgi:hypothetical protein